MSRAMLVFCLRANSLVNFNTSFCSSGEEKKKATTRMYGGVVFLPLRKDEQ